jgi:hypothetical protein
MDDTLTVAELIACIAFVLIIVAIVILVKLLIIY